MRADDVPIAEAISNDAFYDVDVRTSRPSDPEPQRRSAERSERWIVRTRRFLETDSGGCWVAEGESGALGFAVSLVRGRLWVLVTFAVVPGRQGQGIGRKVLARAEAYGAGCELGMLSASDDPLALRRYHQAGFVLYPQLLMRGAVDRSSLPAVDGVRDGNADDLEWMDDLDRSVRGGPHGPDHEPLGAFASLIVTTDRTGYAYATADGCLLLAGRDETAASRLLWECLARSDGEFEVGHVTTANRWAVDIAMTARLSMRANGFLAVRGMDPPSSYIHHGALL